MREPDTARRDTGFNRIRNDHDETRRLHRRSAYETVHQIEESSAGPMRAGRGIKGFPGLDYLAAELARIIPLSSGEQVGASLFTSTVRRHLRTLKQSP